MLLGVLLVLAACAELPTPAPAAEPSRRPVVVPYYNTQQRPVQSKEQVQRRIEDIDEQIRGLRDKLREHEAMPEVRSK